MLLVQQCLKINQFLKVIWTKLLTFVALQPTPNLQLDVFSVNRHHAYAKVNANCLVMQMLETFVGKLKQDARFPYTYGRDCLVLCESLNDSEIFYALWFKLLIKLVTDSNLFCSADSFRSNWQNFWVSWVTSQTKKTENKSKSSRNCFTCITSYHKFEQKSVRHVFRCFCLFIFELFKHHEERIKSLQ